MQQKRRVKQLGAPKVPHLLVWVANHTSAPSPTETTVWFFEVKSNYYCGTSPRTLRVCVCLHLCLRASVCMRVCEPTPIKTPSGEHDRRDGEKEQAAQPCFHHLPPFYCTKNSALTHKNHHIFVCVCVCVCERRRHCYIFHVADDRGSYHSARIRVFDKAALACEGQQACVCLVRVNTVWHIWKRLWWLDRLYDTPRVCVPSLKCLITHFEAPTDGCAHTFRWMMSQRCLYVYRGVCVRCAQFTHEAGIQHLCLVSAADGNR